ncbi:MAG: alpha/beta fold hydrolase [Actinomycetales bacterium]|nr:alpha/beta fold hydrolase [Actinomycetales bacterium]
MSSNSVVIPQAQPWTHEGGSVGILLVHGFTGSPASMVPWGKDLAERGYSVSVPRLPGHGTTWQDMNRTTWRDWYGTADQALTELRERCDQVFVCGLSMGGALALRLAEKRPADVSALVLVNPAVNLDRPELKLIPYLSKVLPAIPGIGNDIAKPDSDEYGYDRTPLRALASQLELWADVRANLSRVTAPVLLFHSTDDHVVDPSSSKIIRDGVSSDVYDHIELSRSFHVATLDWDAPFIMESSAQFIADQLTRG